MHSRHQKTHLWWCRLTAHSSLSVLGPLLDPAFSGPAGSRCFRRRQYTMAASTSASSATAKGRGGVVGFVNKRCAEQLEKRRTAAGIMLTHAAMQGCALKLQRVNPAGHRLSQRSNTQACPHLLPLPRRQWPQQGRQRMHRSGLDHRFHRQERCQGLGLPQGPQPGRQSRSCSRRQQN